MNMVQRILAAAMVTAAGSFSGALAGPPSDEQIAAAIAAYRSAAQAAPQGPDRGKVIQAAAMDALKGLHLSEASAGQLMNLDQAGLIDVAAQSPEMRAALGARADELAKSPNADGATAAIVKMSLVEPFDQSAGQEGWNAYAKRVADAMSQASKHAGLAELHGKGGTGPLFQALGMGMAEHLNGTGAIERLAALLDSPSPVAMTPALMPLFDAAADEKSGVAPAEREAIRTKLLAKADAAIVEMTTPEQARAKTSLERGKTYLNGAHARGELIGHAAPPIEFIWSNSPETLKSWDDLKGKVVVVDFWATWCGPCIVSFPNVRELVEHYEGYPVVVLGVTSIQGNHIKRTPGGRPERIDTRGQPEKEMELMPEFVKDLNMTWPVVFSKQDVFNPDFGVRGIPHVAIIDSKGVVRYRGLHPGATPLAEKAKKIDALLKEAGVTPPPAPAGGEKSGG